MRKVVAILFLSFFLLTLSLFFINSSLAVSVPDLAHSSLSVNSSVPADGSTQVSVTVILKDTSGIPVSGNVVVLKDPDDGTSKITPTSTATDGEGRAVFKITSLNPGTYRLNVIDTTTNTPLNGLGTVVFDSTSGQTQTCTNPAPGKAPTLTSAKASGNNKITLTWTKSSDPFSHYLVAYGLSSGQYQYGNPRIGGRDTTSFTIDSLSPNTKYYFIIKAVNGCMPGANSNELSATTSMPAEIANSPTPISNLTATPEPTTQSAIIIPPTQIPSLVIQNETIEETKPPASTKSEPKNIFIILGIAVMLGVISYLFFRIKRKDPQMFVKYSDLENKSSLNKIRLKINYFKEKTVTFFRKK